MEKFHITDVISLLGLPMPSNGRSSYYIQCPCCDDSPRNKHLNINVKKDVYRCPRCGIYGGIFDLYALYTNTPRDKVHKELLKRLGSPEKVERKKKTVIPTPVIDCPVTDIEARHATYTALLAKLSLAQDHRQNLINRGLSDENIVKLGYKTTPVVGMTAIAKQLQSEGCYLAGVPGFYRTSAGEWSFYQNERGILIPVRDMQGRIQGLQIRRDNVEKRKFRWVSSTDMKDGCRAESWTHIVGPIRPMALLTEGPMKADVIHTLTGLTVIAVPGVNTLTQLEKALTALRKEGLSEIMTAFDMDMATNYYVRDAYKKLLELLSNMNFKYGTYVWDPRYKGLDDFIWEHLLKRRKSQ